MTDLTDEAEAALEPVRERLLADAREDAEKVVAAARQDAAARLDHTRQDTAATVARAREAGRTQAEEAVAREVARARREARGVLLAARETVRLQVRDAVHAAAVELSQEPGYPDLLVALAASARSALGENAVVREAPDGGVLAEAGSLRVDLSLPALADQALRDGEREVALLWTR